MSLEQFEITLRRHYHVSLALLQQAKWGIGWASTEEGRREAEERYRRLLRLHRSVEESYRRVWGNRPPGIGMTDSDLSDLQ